MLGTAAFTAAVLSASASMTAPVLDDPSLTRWSEYLRPAKEELRWQEVPWRATFWEGVAEAQMKERPLLIWAMNGHPLACT